MPSTRSKRKLPEATELVTAAAAEREQARLKHQKRRKRRVDDESGPASDAPADPEEPQRLQPRTHAASDEEDEVEDAAQILDDFKQRPQLLEALQALDAATNDPAALLQPSTHVSQAARTAAKLLLGLATTTAGTGAAASAAAAAAAAPLQELHVGEGFDAEQVWLQLDLMTAPLLKRTHRLMQRAAEVEQLVPPEVQRHIDELLEGEGGGSERSSEGNGDQGDKSGGDGNEGDSGDGDSGDGDSGSEGDDGGSGARKRAVKAAKKAVAGGGAKLLPGEDRFMRLSEMEAFLEQAERGDEELLGSSADEAAESEGDSSDDDGGGGSGGGALRRRRPMEEDEEEEEEGLEALLASSAALVGRTPAAAAAAGRAAQGRRRGGDAGEAADDGAGGVMYKDFYGGQGEDEGEGEEDGSDIDDDDDDGGDDDGDDDAGEAEVTSEDVDGDGEERGGLRSRRRVRFAEGALSSDGGSSGDEDGGGGGRQSRTLSAHERRLLRMQERVRELEGVALADKPWHLTGEVSATQRPLNSALEMDLDFESGAAPPPALTAEAGEELEEMIKRRIADVRFDDVVRVVPPPTEQKKKVLELEDTKASEGLGEVYAREYVAAAAGGAAPPDRHDGLRREAAALLAALCGKLDALARFHYAPKPALEQLEVRSDVAALVVEEVAPLVVSKESMRTPGEAYAPAAAGAAKADGELSREERRAARGKRKRRAKARAAGEEAAAAARAGAAGGSAAIAGRKSLAAQAAAAASSGLLKKGLSTKHGRSEFGRSASAFAAIQQQRDAPAAKRGGAAAGKGAGKGAANSKSLML